MTPPEHVPTETIGGTAAAAACERCGERIGAERVAALPRATTCIRCAGRLKRPSRGRTCS